MTTCECSEHIDLASDGDFIVRGDSLHTRKGCYHVSIFSFWGRVQTVAEVLRAMGLYRLATYLDGKEAP